MGRLLENVLKIPSGISIICEQFAILKLEIG